METFNSYPLNARQEFLSSSIDRLEIPQEAKEAILQKQGLLFSFQTDLESYEDCLKLLKDPSVAACVFTGSLILSFVREGLSFYDAHRTLMQEALSDAIRKSQDENDQIQLVRLGMSLDAVQTVAEALYHEGFID